MMIRFLLCLAVTVAFGFADDAQDNLKKIESYLNNLPTIYAQFTQQVTKQEPIQGVMHLDKKKGRMHIHYPAIQQRLIARNGTLYVVDDQDKSMNDVSVSNTPLSFLLQDKIIFGKTLFVLSQEFKDNQATVTFSSKPDGAEGQMRITFQMKPILKIVGWSVDDMQGSTTTITIQNFKAGIPLDPCLFDRPDY
ncbi:MAG: outer membrane lipoprotein carrier protein LolA [Alphaproteobacteria bacterium]|nr:outer membrane lipoprotein carrier protein LolA [Alphaproteobacteria bacterium]